MIDLQSHHASWAEDFAQEAARIAEALGDRIDAIEHIGSTAVPGLLAKPIIDIATRAARLVDPWSLESEITALGYALHTSGPKNHGIYVRSMHERRTHILHVFQAERWEHCNQRLFRDKLLHDATARARYSAVKEAISGFVDGREYTAAKRGVIEELLNEERHARGLPPVTAWDK